MFYLGKSCFLNGWYSLTSSVKLHQLACLLLNWLNINIGCISTYEKGEKVWNTNHDRIWTQIRTGFEHKSEQDLNTNHNRIWPKINFKTRPMQVASKTDHYPFWSQFFFNLFWSPFFLSFLVAFFIIIVIFIIIGRRLFCYYYFIIILQAGRWESCRSLLPLLFLGNRWDIW